MARTLTTPQLLEHLRDQMEFLDLSSEAFDSGSLAEAKRLAVCARVLLHDTKDSKSLLGQMRWRMNMGFVSTAYVPLRGVLALSASFRLLVLGIHENFACWHPPLAEKLDDRPIRVLMFADWWNETVIETRVTPPRSYSRRDVVLMLANRDGGAHVHPEQASDQFALRARDPFELTFEFKDVGVVQTLPNVEHYTMRQIAFELMVSIGRMAEKQGVKV